jgi:predicted KAP-like P-loop ATPase
MNEAEHKWSADRPGELPEDDVLGRKDFAQRVAKELRNWRKKESLIVSLNGDWGSGKTTLANLILHYVTKQSSTANEVTPIIVRFNPWQWSGQDMLLEAFFDEIGERLEQENAGEKSEQLAKSWKRFGAFFGVGRITTKWIGRGAQAMTAGSLATGNVAIAAAAAGASAAAAAADGVLGEAQEIAEAAATAHEADSPASLAEVREKLKGLLLALEAPLIVVIDDIDRLTREQVRMLVQLVKANADFANVVYLLLYQKSIVAHALNEVTCEKGQDFLKKIVQVELDVPVAPDDKLRKLFGDGLDTIWGRAKFAWDARTKDRWRQLFEDAVWPFFETPRDVKRFLSVFDFYFEGQIDGGYLTVNATDLVLVEVLRMFDPEAFEAVRRAFQKGRSVLVELLYGNTKTRETFALGVKALIDDRKLSEREKFRLRALLFGLFPQASESAGGSSHDSDWDRDYRVCHPKHFPKYFQLHAPPGDVPAKFIARFFDAESDRPKCRELIQQAIEQGVLTGLIERLWIVRDDLSEDRIAPIVGALLDMTDCLPEIKAGLEFDGDAEREMTRVAERLLTRITSAESREAVFAEMIKTCPALTGPVFLTAVQEPNPDRGDSLADRTIRPEAVESAKQILIPKIWAATKTPGFWNLRLAALIIYRLKNWAGENVVREWLSTEITKPDVARKFFRHMLNETHSSGGRGACVTYSLPAAEIEKFVDLDSLLKQVETSKLERLEAVAVEKLRFAIDLKTKGQAYARIPILAFDAEGVESTNPHDLLI